MYQFIFFNSACPTFGIYNMPISFNKNV